MPVWDDFSYIKAFITNFWFIIKGIKKCGLNLKVYFIEITVGLGNKWIVFTISKIKAPPCLLEFIICNDILIT